MSMKTNGSFGMNKPGFTTANNSFNKSSNFGMNKPQGTLHQKVDIASRKILPNPGSIGPTVPDNIPDNIPSFATRSGWMTLIEHLTHPHINIPDPNQKNDTSII